MSTDFKKFGEGIAEIRKKWGYTQKEVYAMTSVSIETQRRIEHGLKEPKISTLERLSLLYKVDLMKFLLNQRQRTSYFSDDMIKFVNRIVWLRDPSVVKPEINKYIEELRKYEEDLSPSQGLESEIVGYFIDFLYVVRDVKPQDYRNKLQNIIEIEKLLLLLDRSKKTMIGDPFQLNIEMTFGLFLVNIYNMDNQTDKSMMILSKLEKSVDGAVVEDLRSNDYKIVILLNKMVAYQINGEFDKMYELSNEIIQGLPLIMSSIIMNDFLFLKALSMYKLNIVGYEHLIQTLLLIESKERMRVFFDELKAYGYVITPPN